MPALSKHDTLNELAGRKGKRAKRIHFEASREYDLMDLACSDIYCGIYCRPFQRYCGRLETLTPWGKNY